MFILKAIIAIVSCALIACLFHYFWTAANNPRRLISIIDEHDAKFLYLAAVLIGGGIIIFSGFDKLLSWMPLSWGSHDEDGNFNPTRHGLAGFMALLIFPLLGYVESSARGQVDNDYLRQRVRELEDELATAKRSSPQAT